MSSYIRRNDLSNFTFEFAGYGHYRVTYTTPKRGDYWRATLSDMPLIDATKNADIAKATDIMLLRSIVIRKGSHYNKDGVRLD